MNDEEARSDDARTDVSSEDRPVLLDRTGAPIAEVRAVFITADTAMIALNVRDVLSQRVAMWVVEGARVRDFAKWSGTQFAAPAISGTLTGRLFAVHERIPAGLVEQLSALYEQGEGTFTGDSAPGTGSEGAMSTPPGPGDPDGDL
ncbi:hypothetical protein CTKZ_08580 [Cellulomonas algicola]|uniref:Uncharacterized protein n=1 Tax=Cellulomonas algicola TaxID=2071633 RepID=A0A401UX79_9CELL|nr:hypothetical protein [Cellulomonas algicola]GCD19296.1 hypothetical protein CTKZ_08580 [Cellulomonas algicola]